MKTNKTFAYGLFAVILVLSLTGCPDPDPTHTHDYGTEWKSNATQHWRECSCGEKADIANHTGDPCDICGYASGSQNPDLCECNGKAEDCDCVDCDCETCEEEIIPPPCECNGNAEDCECEDCDCETCDPPDTREPVITSYSATPATITVPAENSVQLKCTAISADGSAVKSIQWTVEQKPALANPTIANAQTDTATVNDIDVAGTYKFKLVVTGNNDITKTEYVTVIAGLDYEVEFGAVTVGSATLDFSPSASTPLPKGVTYTVYCTELERTYSGTELTANISDGYTDFETYTFTQIFKNSEGTEIQRRVIKVDVVYGFSELSINNAQVSVIPSVTLKWPADSLVAHAQAAPTHTLANNLTVTLDGKGSTGNITAYAWECASYTANQGAVSVEYTKAEVDALITNAGTATATVAPRKAGTYVFKLTVTDNDGESDTDTVAVVVEAAEVTVNLAQLDLSVGVPISLNLTPTIGAGWENLNYSKLSFTLSETDEDSGDSTTYFECNNNTVSIPNNYADYTSKHPRITQTFSYNGKEIGSFYFNLRARDMGSGAQFYRIYRYVNGVLSTAYTSFPNEWTPTLTISEVE